MTNLSTRDTFILFLRAGFSLPGTGYALLSLLESELVRRRALLAPGEFRDTAATAQCMPGVFAFNLGAGLEAYKKAVDLLLDIRMEAKRNKDWATSDKIRNELTAIGFDIKDTKDGVEWKL